MIPEGHPRYHSLKLRERLVEGYEEGLTALEGLIAHGRGEAFNYLLGERTVEPAMEAVKAGAALLALGEHPVVTVNGNTAVLCPEEMVELSKVAGARLEVNLFYRSEGRVRKIREKLFESGAKEVLGEHEVEISGLGSERRKVSREGQKAADVVIVALEDGDRTEALVGEGKKVVAVDLNPLSRTAKEATVAIVDDVLRAVPLMIKKVEYFKSHRREALATVEGYDRGENLKGVLKEIRKNLE